MRLLVLSDLHLEFENFLPPEFGYDLVVLAGDIGVGMRGVEWAGYSFDKDIPILYLPGNHEYYANKFTRDIAETSYCDIYDNVKVLNNVIHEQDDIVFICSTLWTDFMLEQRNLEEGFSTHQYLNDYFYINTGEKQELITPELIFDLHFTSKNFIIDNLIKYKDKKTVVVTHHGVSPQSVHKEFEGSNMNNLFSSDLTGLILEHQPNLWIHGHTHKSHDYTIGNTRVVVNPKGYKTENGYYFNPELIIEV